MFTLHGFVAKEVEYQSETPFLSWKYAYYLKKLQ